MAEQEDKCPLCGEQMLSLACPGGCFTATAHEVDGLACKLRQYRAKAKTKIDRLNKLVADLTNSLKETREALVNRDETCERLSREHTEAIAACAGLTYQRDQYHAVVGFLLDGLDSNLDDKGGLTSAEWDVIIAKSRKLVDEGSEPSPGQPLLDDNDRLRRLEAAVEDDELACYIATEHVCRPTSCSAIETYRAALRSRRWGRTDQDA